MESRLLQGAIFKEALMRMIYLTDSARTGPRQPWGVIAKLIMGIAAAAALLIIVLVGLIIVLPLALLGGLAMYVYLRRRLRKQKQKPNNDVIDADYTVIERRD
jgi:Flp pilus assembly protein TadB